MPSFSIPELKPSRFPALARLWPRQNREIPILMQMQSAQCGATCLAMTLSYLGRDTTSDEVAKYAGGGALGTNAQKLVEAAEHFGAQARVVRLEMESLADLPRGSILHWGFDHFVVLDRVTTKGIRINDPSGGRRNVSLREVDRTFTGVAITIYPTDTLERLRASNGSTMTIVWQMLRDSPYVWRIFTISMALRVLGLGLPFITGAIIDRVVPMRDYSLLVLMTLGFALATLLNLFGTHIRGYTLLRMRIDLDARLAMGLMDALVSHPYQYFLDRSRGDLMLRVNGLSAIRTFLTSGGVSVVLDGLFVVVYLVLLLLASPTIAVVALGMSFIQLGIYQFTRKRIAGFSKEALARSARTQSYLYEFLNGIRTYKASGIDRTAVQKWSNLYVDELNTSITMENYNLVLGFVRGFASSMQPGILLALGAYVVLEGDLSVGSMLAVNTIATSFFGPLQALIGVATQVQQLEGHVDRINDVISDKDLEDHEGGGTIPGGLTGAVEFDNITFRYGPHIEAGCKNVSFKIEPGNSLALVGMSGSGKSTIVSLALRLFDPQDGIIRFDGRDADQLNILWLRKQIGYVPQKADIFSGSIFQNISMLNPQASREQVIEAARQACIHDEIQQKPMGYDTDVGDGGNTFSGGQRQRIAIARALVKKPQLLILDEATNELDALTERAVMRNLRKLNCTRILIAHRLTTITDCDEIMVMKDTHVVERGTHQELLARRGLYREMWGSQSSDTRRTR